MELFGFGKKKEEKTKKPVCACNGGFPDSETMETKKVNSCCLETKEGTRRIKVLGSGCASCHALYENAQAAVKKMEPAIKVEFITDLQTVMKYGVMSVPALVIDEKVVSTGKVLKVGDIQKLLKKLGF